MIVRGDREMRLADGEDAIHQGGEIVIACRQRPGPRRDHGGADVGRGRCCGAGRAAAAEACGAGVLTVDEATQGRGERRIRLTVEPALIVRGDGEMCLANGERAIHQGCEIIIGCSQRPCPRGDDRSAHTGRTRRGGAGCTAAAEACGAGVLAINEATQAGGKHRIRLAIEPALVVRSDREVRFADGERAIHQGCEIIIGCGQRPGPRRDDGGAHTGRTRCRGAGRTAAAETCGAGVLAIDEAAQGRGEWRIRLTVEPALIVRGDGEVCLADGEGAIGEGNKVILIGFQPGRGNQVTSRICFALRIAAVAQRAGRCRFVERPGIGHAVSAGIRDAVISSAVVIGRNRERHHKGLQQRISAAFVDGPGGREVP